MKAKGVESRLTGSGQAMAGARAALFSLAMIAAGVCAAQPEAARDAFTQGLIEGKTGLYQKAVGFFDEAIRLDPKFTRAYYNRGVSYQELGQNERAIKDYSEAIRLDPGFSDAYAGRGTAYENLKRYEQAIKDYGEAIRLAPHEANNYANRASSYDKLGRYQEAIQDYNEAIKLDPRDDDALDSLAWLLATGKNPALRDGKRAVELALQACELTHWKEPGHIDTLAAAYARAGDFAAAVKWQMKALEDKEFAKNRGAQERLQLYRAGKPFPPN
ncbi:MAG: tetratricopeptide repeat protein [Betaproteobacteria bacterium]|nr:tetratricopeptide repeat protein [Betaproteobacteria bacterium]